MTTLTARAENGLAVVALEGPPDAALLPGLRALAPALAASGGVAVDLTAAERLDGRTLAVLIDALLEAEQQERTLVFVLPQDGEREVSRIFSLSGAAELLPIARSLAEARERVLARAARVEGRPR